MRAPRNVLVSHARCEAPVKKGLSVLCHRRLLPPTDLELVVDVCEKLSQSAS